MDKVLIEWTYMPKSFLEDTHELGFCDNIIHFKHGLITLEMNEKMIKLHHDLISDAEEIIKKYLDGISIQSHCIYKLSRKATKYLDENGQIKKLSVGIISVGSGSSAGNLDIQITEKGGTIRYDSKKERIAKNKFWGKLTSDVKAEDQVLLRMYSNAIKEPENELIHLFEILEYISEKFGGRDKARKKLSILKSDINTFATIVNDPHIKEGRHRGKKADKLRRASPEELKFARRIAKKLMSKYLKHQQSK